MVDTTHQAIRQRLTEACLELVRIQSVTGDERRLSRHLDRWATKVRLRDDIIRAGEALVIGQPDGNRPCVALVGHMDTVPPSPEDPAPHWDGVRVVGLGASDMKGSLAVMQVLFETLALDTLPFVLMLVLYDREEGPYATNGLQPLLDNYELLRSIDLALVMEPTDNTLQLGCLGGLHTTVTYRGKSAHSARPWQGDNAIHKAGPLLSQLTNKPWRQVNVEGLVFQEAMAVTLAHGGRARNVVPDRFELNLNYRFAPGRSSQEAMDAALAEVQKLVGEAEIEVHDVAPPGPVPVDNAILDHFRATAELDIFPKQAWTDVARLAAHGIDAVNFGPGSPAQAHQVREHISVDAMVTAYEILAHVLSTPMEPV
jgi:succinyl-diaminopimelate desuccinylase